MEQLTFTKALDLFMQSLDNRDCSNHTLTNYHHLLETFYVHLASEIFNGEVYVQDISMHHIEEHLLYRKNVLGNSAVTRENALIAINSMFKFLLKHHYITYNPAEDVEHIKLPKKERVFLTADEMKKLLDTIDNPHIFAAVSTLCYTGLRISELYKLLDENVDFKKKEILVKCGKNKKDRVVPICSDLLKILKDYRKNIRNPKSGYFFSTPRSGRLCGGYINEKLHEATEKCGIQKNVTPHVLRHSAASLMVLNNAPISAVQRILGHADLKTTSRYLHVKNEDLHQATELLKF